MEPIGAVWSSPKAQTTPTLACNAADQSRKLSLAEWGLAIILQRNGFSLRDVADGSFASIWLCPVQVWAEDSIGSTGRGAADVG